MTAYAQVIDGAVTRIVDLDLNAVPGHKKAWFRPYVQERPTSGPLMRLLGPERVVEPDRVVDRWTDVRVSMPSQIAAVKAEARRRILGRFPEWKQANMTATGVDLTRNLVLNGKWTQDEAATASAIEAAWGWIKAVRAASDAIEQMALIPLDFETDTYWPV